MKTFLTHWKTTANGVLAFLITTLTVLSGFLGDGDITTSGNPSVSSIHTHTWVTLGITIALAMCRAWVGLLQQDSGIVTAIVPGNSTPVAVPGHEVPNNPAATPVIKGE